MMKTTMKNKQKKKKKKKKKQQKQKKKWKKNKDKTTALLIDPSTFEYFVHTMHQKRDDLKSADQPPLLTVQCPMSNVTPVTNVQCPVSSVHFSSTFF
ncbi:hypothetical protein BELL_0024g00280 [Botrytis elliptica]|uniref:Uncharacterized protein n=1 Tax=Botrytis elliptica TaxID=278938 RepID=A0A4Z1K0Q7_9HELO|nr:hypothetical protein BELL_0024g00280 [Botrytis elliptica]